MNIEKIEYGNFDEIDFLSPMFTEKKNKLRIVVRLDSSLSVWSSNIPNIVSSINDLLQECKEQDCIFSKYPAETNYDHSFDKDLSDLPNIMEHIILGLIYKISKVRDGSGLTCLLNGDTNLYNIFIECDDPQLGEFAAMAAKNLMEDVLVHSDRSPLWSYLIDMAAFIYPASINDIADKKLGSWLGWSKPETDLALNTLKSLSFFHNYSGIA